MTQRRRMSRRSLLRALGIAAVAAGTSASASYYAARIEPTWAAVERITVPLKNLPAALDGLKIAHMSDFHLHPYTQIDFIRSVVARTNQLAPDLVVLTGDYVLEQAESIFELAPVLGGLNATHGVYAILGNHDLWTDAAVVEQGLTEARIPLLNNQTVPIAARNAALYLAGLDDLWSGQPDLSAALASVPADGPTVLLAHEPDFADVHALDGRIGLQLSGHTHGGQVRLPGIGALVLPPYGRKYDQGLYQVQGMTLYTTRGVGVIGPPVRFNCRPEITEITLTVR